MNVGMAFLPPGCLESVFSGEIWHFLLLLRQGGDSRREENDISALTQPFSSSYPRLKFNGKLFPPPAASAAGDGENMYIF